MKCSICYSSALAIWCAMSLVGCGGQAGPKLYSAGGKVTYQGQPVKNATVVFQPDKGPVATGTTDESGKFTLSTGPGSGAVEGKYQIAVTAVSGGTVANMTPEEYAKQGEMPTAERKSLIPEKYNDIANSGLTAIVTITPEKNQFDLSLAD
jgi:hypothetical protein